MPSIFEESLEEGPPAPMRDVLQRPHHPAALHDLLGTVWGKGSKCALEGVVAVFDGIIDEVDRGGRALHAHGHGVAAV